MTTTGPVSGVDRAASAAAREAMGKARASGDGTADVRTSLVGPATILDLSSTAKAASKAVTGSTDFATVARDARAALDAGYAETGKTSWIHATGDERTKMFGGLDRRSLYAVKSNAGGHFSEDEQKLAAMEMTARTDAATGQDHMGGVTDNGTIRDMFKRTVSFLDGASDEEKGSFDWARQRARAQWSYENVTKGMGEVPETMDSTNPIAKMIKAALDSLTTLGDPSKQLEDMPLYKRAEQLFAGGQTGPGALDLAV